MSADIFKGFLIASCIGTVLSLILYLLKPVTKKYLSSGWNYYVWLTVLVVMILPIQIPNQHYYVQPEIKVNESYINVENENVPEINNDTNIDIPPTINSLEPEHLQPTESVLYETENKSTVNITDIAVIVWIIGASVMFLFKVLAYIIFLFKVKRNSEVVPCSETKKYTKRKVVTRTCALISSPLITGIVKPMLLLPRTDMSEEQMSNVLSHEMVHLKRNDILYKWFATIVKCIHWFNPIMYFVTSTINKECEISCDYEVVKTMSMEQKIGYVDTIIALISTDKTRVNALTTEMSGKKKSLKERLLMIKTRKKISKKTVIISSIVSFAALIGAVVAVGMLNGMFFKNTPAKEEEIKLTNNATIINFENKPFIQGDMAYFPLEELTFKLNPKNKVEHFDTGYVLHIENATETYTVKESIKEIYYSGQGGTIRETDYSPILKDDVLYIPYEYVRYIFVDGNDYNIGGSFLYKNEKMNIKFEIPLGWCGKYIIDTSAENEYVIVFKHKATAEKYDFAGTLFSIYKIEDSSVDEAMRVYGNMTVVWRNSEFAYVVARPTDVQHPIWIDRDEEDIDIATEYESLYAGINHIQETFNLIDESKEKTIPAIANAENLSYAEIKDLQRMVDEGHFPWRLDYEQVIMMWVSAQGEDVEGGRIVAFSGGGLECSATYIVNGNTYLVELFKPIRNDEYGIWIVRSCEKQIPSIAHGIYFYKRTLGQEWILQRDDGWYNMIQYTMAVFPGEALGIGVLPKSIVAYFTDAGTNTEQYQREVGRADGPFEQIPITLELNFSENDTLGHLHFVYYYENGTTKTSQYYNVLVE